MRERGARVGVGDVLCAHRALAAVDAASREQSYFALRAALCASRKDLAIFDAAFVATFVSDRDALELEDLMHAAAAVIPRVAPPPEVPLPLEVDAEPVPAASSDQELLMEKDFGAYTAAERAAARAVMARLVRRGPQRRSRRTRAAHRRTELYDRSATLRAALRTAGEPVTLRYREPRTAQRPLVLVVDVSGSMSPYARMLLQYAQAAVAARRRVEAFAQGTRLTRITLELRGRDPDRALGRATAQVVDLGGGTRIGAALSDLNRIHGRRVGRGAVVVILSDGWDRGEPETLAAEMARLSRSAHRLVWLNPLAASPGFAPLTRGMQAALPHTDHLLPGNSLSSLVSLAELLESFT
ncbi:MAG: uncharacterized protein QOF76_2010 [Solirubrobacteraceae bacterium]|nr:uncharacterized protein [Solirubrobacteraceae bacterium]